MILGVGLMNKLSVTVLGLAIAVAALLTPLRSDLRRKGPWIALAVAIAIFLPHVIWQLANGMPTLEFIENAKRYKIADIGPMGFLAGQIMDNHPANFIVWLAGLTALLFSKKLRKFRLFAFVYLIAFAVFVAQKSKVYYLSPVYSVMFAAGAIAIEDVARRRFWGWLRWATVVSIVACPSLARTARDGASRAKG